MSRWQNLIFVSTLSLGLAVLCPYSFATASAGANSEYQGSLEIEAGKSFSRLKLSIDHSFKPVINEVKNGFEVVIPSATLMDIGVPFGAEEAFNEYLNTVKDSRLEHLEVKESDSKLVVRGRYRFPTGPMALADPKMEHFDFRRDEEGKFIIDFFYKKGMTVAEAAKEKRLLEAKKREAERQVLLKKEAERKASRDKRLEEAKNAVLFCEQPFDRNNTVFLKFRADHPLFKFSTYFPEQIPDHLYEYAEPKGSSEEAEMVRLALKLANENKEALSVKTIEFLEKEYPKSKNLPEMSFLKANNFYRLGFQDKGRALLQEIAKRNKGTKVGLQAAAFLAVQSFKNKEWLAALDSFMSLKREMPNHPLIWLFRYGIAESFYQIKQSDQAKVEYEWVAKNAPKSDVRAEAEFKVGDIYFDRNQFAQAITYYEAAIKKQSSSVSLYPQVLMNLAESYFQLDELKKSEEVYQRYLLVGGNQPNAWRASLRIAEIKSIHQKASPTTEAAYTETVNRYPMTPGAVVARLRMLPCGNHGGFDLVSAQRFLTSPEVKNFDGDGIVYAEPFKELVALTEMRTLLSFQQNETAVKQGLAHLRENPSVEIRKLIEQSMIGAIKRVLEKQLNDNDPIAAISTYEKYGDFLPLPLHDPMADGLKMRLAKAASERKLTILALKIIEPYKQVNEQATREVVAAIERNLVLDGMDEQEERSFIEAKTLWNNPNFKADDPKQSERLLARLGFIRDESKFSFERDLIFTLFYVDAGEATKADAILERMVSRMNKLTPRERVQVLSFAGETAISAQDLDFAAKVLKQARQSLQKLSEKDQGELSYRHLNSVPTLNYLYQIEGETLEKLQKWKEAVALYSEAIENKVGGNHLLYAHAKALLKEGGRDSKKVASQSLEKIQQSQEDDVWKRLARETLSEIAKEGKVDEKRNP